MVMLDSAGETNMILASVAISIGAKIQPTSQSALQAEGRSKMSVKGDTSILFYFQNKPHKFEGLVVEHLDVAVLAGMPFLQNERSNLAPIQVFYHF